MRINGRTLRPSNLAERRLLLSMGRQELRVPRSHNPYGIARMLRRAADGRSPILEVRELVASFRCRLPGPAEPRPSPDMDLAEPVLDDHVQ